MADDAGEKTEPATPRRIAEARQQGNVARSPELNSAVGLLIGMLCLGWFGPRLLSAMMECLREQFGYMDPTRASYVDVNNMAVRIGLTMLSAVGPIMLGLLVAATASNLFQVGWLMTPEPLMPKFSKLNPLNGFSRLFSARTFVQLAINLVKVAVVGFVAYRAMRDRMGDVMLALETGGAKQMLLMATLLYEVGIQLALAMLAIALIDYVWQKFKFARDMRMSKQEVKEEMRRLEGDPIMKQRRRRAQLAAAMQRIRSTVPKADVIVTNPTELAIAIQYDAEKMAAPRVVAKGQGFLARKIREIAATHRVPIIERKPLAQALFKTVDVGQEVPEQFYKAIAEILAYVYELSGKKAAIKAA